MRHWILLLGKRRCLHQSGNGAAKAWEAEIMSHGALRGRMPELDGIRGLAAVSVVAFHAMWWPRWLPIGRIAVWVFFVLSGFLITGILLRSRDFGGDRRRAWGVFCARRSLRIFPIYFLALGVGLALDLPGVWDHAGWYATYMTNVPNLWGVIKDGALGHFWSLAVEEQFYLAWPVVILFLSPGRLQRILPALVLTGLASAAVLAFAWPDPRASMHATPTCVLGLAVGAWLAVDRHEGRSSQRRARVCLGLGLVALAVFLGLHAVGRIRPVRTAAELAAWTFLAAWLISRAADGFGGTVGRVLASRPLMTLGAISYGIYVYHLPILNRLYAAWPTRWPKGVVLFAVALALTLAVAAVSWRYVESPLLRLKERFPQEPEAQPIPSGSQVLETVG